MISCGCIFFAKMATETFTIVMIGAITVGIIAILFICQIFLWRRQNKRQQALIKAADSEYRSWRCNIYRSGKLSAIPTSICLGKGEHCYYKVSATLSEPKSIRKTTHFGGAVHVAKGVTLGGGNSISELHDEWRKISSGTLYVTNRRIIFDGDMQNRTVKLSELLSVLADARRIAISASNRQKTMLFSDLNGQIAHDIITILRKSAT